MMRPPSLLVTADWSRSPIAISRSRAILDPATFTVSAGVDGPPRFGHGLGRLFLPKKDVRMKRMTLMLAALTLLLGGLGQAKADFINGSFETGDFTGWTVGGTDGGHGVARGGNLINGTFTGYPYEPGSFGPTYVAVRTGAYAAYTASGSSYSEFGDFLTLYQNLSLEPGTYKVGYYLAVNSPQQPLGYGASGNAIFVNGSNILPSDFSGTLNSAFFEVSGQFTTSGGLTPIELHITGSGDGRAGISIDNAFLNPVITSAPEPASLTLFGIALAGMAGCSGWRRR
jgi:PEP-CTERM motif